MPKLSEITANTATVKRDLVDMGAPGEILTITYRPGAMTPEQETRLRVKVEAEDANFLVEFLLDMVVSWDLLEDDGQPLELTKDRLSRLSFDLLGWLLETISNDIVGKAEARAKTSRSSLPSLERAGNGALSGTP